MTSEYHRVLDYAERSFQQSGRTQFPTVRQVARACRCSHSFVQEAIESTGGGCLDGVNIEGWTLGDLEVCVFARP